MEVARSKVLEDETIELGCSGVASIELAHRTGNRVGARAIDAVESAGGLVSVETEQRAVDLARKEAKTAQALSYQKGYGKQGGYKGQQWQSWGPYGGGKNKNGKSKGKGKGKKGDPPACFLCHSTEHFVRDCPMLGKIGTLGQGPSGDE